uniref:BUD13 homolog n=1 Tax=Mola mola TaxID=94237 RepID=A0A3Q4BTA6_MOLML
MAASTGNSKGPELSKAEYLKRYLSSDEVGNKSKGKIKKKRRKVPEKGLKIVDDDIDWKEMVNVQEEIEEEEDEVPVIAEVIDERPEEVKQLEAFRTSNRWKVIGARHDSPDVSPPRKVRHDSPDVSPPRKVHHDSPDVSPPRRARHDSPDVSPPRKARHDSPDLSPQRRSRRDSSDLSPPRQHSRRSGNGQSKDSDQSHPRMRPKTSRGSDSDQSPPRRRPRHGKHSDEDLSPPRSNTKSDLSQISLYVQSVPRMLSGGKAGLVSLDVLREEQEEKRRREKHNQPLEDESRNAKTVFRDKTGKRRDLESEREEQRRKAGEKAAKDEKYAQWGKGLAQSEMQQQKLEDALHEAQKPLARHLDDEDLDRMLREQEREGDPMAAMLRRKKDRNTKMKGFNKKPRYKGPTPPPNRFNILPGYRWDGVDRSNGFEQKRYTRIADKKAVQEAAYKWSVEDM